MDPNTLSGLITTTQETIAALVQANLTPALEVALSDHRRALYAMQSALADM